MGRFTSHQSRDGSIIYKECIFNECINWRFKVRVPHLAVKHPAAMILQTCWTRAYCVKLCARFCVWLAACKRSCSDTRCKSVSSCCYGFSMYTNWYFTPYFQAILPRSTKYRKNTLVIVNKIISQLSTWPVQNCIVIGQWVGDWLRTLWDLCEKIIKIYLVFISIFANFYCSIIFLWYSVKRFIDCELQYWPCSQNTSTFQVPLSFTDKLA